MRIMMLKLMFFLSLLFVSNISAQNAEIINTGEIYIGPDTKVAIMADFDNKDSGIFTNDGIVSFYYNFNNDGEVSFSNNSAYTQFIGTNIQKISGSTTSDFHDILFRNMGTDLSGWISVTGEADFMKGIVNNEANNGTFVFTSSGHHVHASDSSHVQGLVYNHGNLFEIPVGNEKFYRPMKIQPAAGGSIADLDLYEGQYFYRNTPHNPHSKKNKEKLIDFIDDQEYWELTSVAESTNITDLILTWNKNTTPSQILTDKKNTSIAIVRWDESKEMWTIEKGSEVNLIKKTVKAPLTTPLAKEKVIFTLARVFNDTQDQDGIVFYNAISPNGDGINDYFYISGLDNFPDNTLEIYSRGGVKIFETKRYGINNNWFRGISNGNNKQKKQKSLATGTYYYIFEYKTPEGKRKNRIGYLYIN